MFEKISNPDWKIAVKKPDCVRADVFELCLIIADLLGIYGAFIERSILNCRWGNFFRSTGAYTLFENATFAHERGARSSSEHFLWISTAPGGLIVVWFCILCQHFWQFTGICIVLFLSHSLLFVILHYLSPRLRCICSWWWKQTDIRFDSSFVPPSAKGLIWCTMSACPMCPSSKHI